MSEMNDKPPLVFEGNLDLGNILMKVYTEGGLEELRRYISEQFTARRVIEVGEQTSSIFDVQLRYLNKGEPGEVILEYKTNPTAEDSKLAMTVNLIDVEPNMQLVVRASL